MVEIVFRTNLEPSLILAWYTNRDALWNSAYESIIFQVFNDSNCSLWIVLALMWCDVMWCDLIWSDLPNTIDCNHGTEEVPIIIRLFCVHVIEFNNHLNTAWEHLPYLWKTYSSPLYMQVLPRHATVDSLAILGEATATAAAAAVDEEGVRWFSWTRPMLFWPGKRDNNWILLWLANRKDVPIGNLKSRRWPVFWNINACIDWALAREISQS